MNASLKFILLIALSPAVALAYPPAPQHTLFGLVRDELGRPLKTGSGTVIVSHAAGEIVRAPVEVMAEAGYNYLVRIPVDQGVMAGLYTPTALLPASPFTLRVLIDGTSYVPLQVSRVQPNIGQPGERTRLDLTLGVDSDNDGLPDAWERALIAASEGRLGSLADILPGDDIDGDGLSNLQEYLLGTYALDRADGLALEIVDVSGGRARLRFGATVGRTYTIRTSTDLSTWTPTSFSLTVSGEFNLTSYSSREVTAVEAWVSLPPGGSAFYRLYVE